MYSVGETVAEMRSNKKLATEVRTELERLIKSVMKPWLMEGFEDTITFEEFFGGNFYVIESLEDLREIKTARGSNLYESADIFDSCREASNGYYMVLLCTNNSGGNTYYIPPAFVTKNVLESEQLTEGAWNPMS